MIPDLSKQNTAMMDKVTETYLPFLNILNHLPQEIVHQVLDYLPLAKALQLLSYNTKHIEDAIRSHLHYQRIFNEDGVINNVVTLFLLLYFICKRKQETLSKHEYYVNAKALAYGVDSRVDHKLWKFQQSCFRLIHKELSHQSGCDPVEGATILDLLIDSPYSLTHTLDPLFVLERWHWAGADTHVSVEKSIERRGVEIVIPAEWKDLENLVFTPENRFLNKTLDPRQTAPVLEDGTYNQTQTIAKLTLDDRALVSPWLCSCIWDIKHPQPLPHDRYLRLLLATIAMHPPPNDVGTIQDSIEKMTVDDCWGPSIKHTYPDSNITSSSDIENSCNINNCYDFRSNIDSGTVPQTSVYPPEIIKSLKITIQGLTFIYTGTPLLMIQRIKWHPAEWWEGPIFSRHKNHHRLRDIPEEEQIYPPKWHSVDEKRELEWLEAFLKVVCWMEENIQLSPKKYGFTDYLDIQRLATKKGKKFWKAAMISSPHDWCKCKQ